MDGYSLNTLIIAVSGFISRVASANLRFPDKSKKRKELKKAIASIQTAMIHTQVFIKEKGYEKNIELSDLWVKAFKNAVIVEGNSQFPDYLMQKAKFWSDPQSWFDEDEAIKLVPKLSKINDDCDVLMKQLS